MEKMSEYIVPTYDYCCPRCFLKMELNRSIHGEITDVPCPDCKDVNMNRVWTAPPVQFNAGGFYSTDNPKK